MVCAAAEVATPVSRTLEGNGHQVRVADDAVKGFREFHRRRPDLVILCEPLQPYGCLEACQRIRQRADVPIVVLGEKGDEFRAVRALEAGADLYLSSEALPELLLRVGSLLRAYAAKKGALTRDMGGDELQITADGKPIRLTPTELSLLSRLTSLRGGVLPTEVALEEMWGKAASRKNLQFYVQRLRSKLGLGGPYQIRTVRGVGYGLTSPTDDPARLQQASDSLQGGEKRVEK